MSYEDGGSSHGFCKSRDCISVFGVFEPDALRRQMIRTGIMVRFYPYYFIDLLIYHLQLQQQQGGLRHDKTNQICVCIDACTHKLQHPWSSKTGLKINLGELVKCKHCWHLLHQAKGNLIQHFLLWVSNLMPRVGIQTDAFYAKSPKNKKDDVLELFLWKFTKKNPNTSNMGCHTTGFPMIF